MWDCKCRLANGCGNNRLTKSVFLYSQVDPDLKNSCGSSIACLGTLQLMPRGRRRGTECSAGWPGPRLLPWFFLQRIHLLSGSTSLPLQHVEPLFLIVSTVQCNLCNLYHQLESDRGEALSNAQNRILSNPRWKTVSEVPICNGFQLSLLLFPPLFAFFSTCFKVSIWCFESFLLKKF